MEFKGTKGEWNLDMSAMTVSTNAKVDGDIICDAPESFNESMENWESNAKLIAAAPDLLKAAQAALTILEDSNHHKIDWVRGTVRNAIEKALK